MLGYWKRLNFLLKNQVYMRVLPVVFGAVLLVGLLSWVVFDRQATRAALAHQQQELQMLTEAVGHRLIREALAWELVRDENDDGDALLVGAGAIPALEPAEAPRPPRWLHGDRRDLARAERIVARWQMENRDHLSADFAPASWRGVRAPGRPVSLYGDGARQVYVFAPLAPDGGGDGPAALQRGRLWAPVLIRRTDGPEHALLLVDLRALLDELDSGGAWCLLTEEGDLQAASPAFAAAGLLGDIRADVDLAGQPAAAGRDEAIDRLCRPRTLVAAGLLGGEQNQWLVAADASRGLPWRLVTARPAGQIRGVVLRYFAAILAAALLALIGATWSITRVLARVTRRLQGLAENMEALARGDYAQRLREGPPDEIGALEGYFNMMAGSLEAAQRQVRDQAAHLRAALENMRLLDRAKDDFLVLISHEVRTPLTAITGGVKYLRSRIEKLPDREHEVVAALNIEEITSIIESSSDRLTGFMNDAIQMTSFQSNERRLNLAPVPVGHVVEVGLCGIRERALKRGITVRNELEDQTDWSILCDLDVLKTAFEKILDNAVTHNVDAGEIRIGEAPCVPGVGDVSVLPTTESVGRLLQQPAYRAWGKYDLRWRLIEIHNSGPAISDAKRSALFGKFELVGRIEHHQQGSGLSLPIAKTVVEQHGGRIFLQSEDHFGNSLYLLLPTFEDCPAEAEPSDVGGVWDDVDDGDGGTPWDEDVGEVADGAPFGIELDDLGAGGAGGLDEAGGGVDGAGGADHEEEITLTHS